MKKYVLLGAGASARMVIKLLGKDKIAFLADNNITKSGSGVEGIPVRYFPDYVEEARQYPIIISVSEQYQAEIRQQLAGAGITNIETMSELQARITREKIQGRPDYIAIYQRAIDWVHRGTVDGQSIICNTDKRLGYPEVTGYYIPTLLRWGYRELAVSFAKWLCDIQKPDGSWYDTDDESPYIFDTAQILKGLLAVRELYPEADSHIIAGCNWILSCMEDTGRLVTPTEEAWGDAKTCSELIHLYCLSPLADAAEVLHMPQYKAAAHRILDYYKTNRREEIMSFGLLSHFYAYVMEGLLDMGEEGMVREAMDNVAKLQKESGAAPAYNDVEWVCSTGLFQFALVWFRLGEIERANRAFTYACKLQNKSGGWYGSYLSEENADEENTYFPTSEISWAVKYFLDALYYKNLAEFERQADSFLDTIEKTDGRYQIVRNSVASAAGCENEKKRLRILDAGCGKGRYLRNLLEDEPENSYYAVDLSKRVMRFITDDRVIKKQGTLTNLVYPDNYFDMVYTCEALEHAIDVESAVREMARVTKPGGKIVVIDKNRNELGRMEIGEWEIWFEAGELRSLMSKYCSLVEVIENISYEGHTGDKLFSAWIGMINK